MSIWRDTIRGMQWFGNGLGQYYITFPHYSILLDTLLARPEHVHNDYLEIVYEFGLGSVFVLVFGWSISRSSLPAERAMAMAFAVEAFLAFPLYMPTTAAVFALVAGRLAVSGPSLRDDLIAGRMALRNRMERIAKFCRGGVPYPVGGRPVSSGIPHQELGWIPLHRREQERCDY